jgi:hypothetical protein
MTPNTSIDTSPTEDVTQVQIENDPHPHDRVIAFNDRFMWWGKLGETLVVNKRSTLRGRPPMYVGDELRERVSSGKIVRYELVDVDDPLGEDFFFKTKVLGVLELVS